MSRPVLVDGADRSPQSQRVRSTLLGLVWAMLPLRRLSAPLRVLVAGSALLALVLHLHLMPNEAGWLAGGIYQSLLLMVVVSSALVPVSPSLAERLWPLNVSRVFAMQLTQRLLLGLAPYVLISLLGWAVRSRLSLVNSGVVVADNAGVSIESPWFETAFVLLLASVMPFLAVQSPLAAESESRIRRTRVIVMSSAWLLVALQWFGEPWRLLVPATAALLVVPLAWWKWREAFSAKASATCEDAGQIARTTHAPSRPAHSAERVVSDTHAGMRVASSLVSPVEGKGPGLLDTWRVVWVLSPTRWYWVFASVFHPLLIVYSAYHGSRSSNSIFLALFPAMLMLVTAQGLSVLPVHPWRRMQLAILTFPVATMIAIVLGIGLRHAYGRPLTHTGGAPYEESVAGDWDNPSRVQLAFWRWSGADRPPLVVAPWGERVEPFAARLLGWWLYNPFTVRDESSEAFQRWQWQRLTTAVYGQVVPREEFNKRSRQHPPMRSERWPVLLLRTAFTFHLMLLLTLPVWKARANRLSWRTSFWTAAYLVPVVLPIVAGSLADGLRLGFVSGVVDQLLMALAARLPTDSLALAASLLTLTILPALAALGLLRRASMQPVMEFAAGSEVGRRGPWG